MRIQGKWIAGMLAGAGLMYLLDPDRGARRRALVRDKATHARRKLGEGLEGTARDLRNRTKGAAAELQSRFRREAVDDDVLHERVRSAIGRAVSHPSAINVTVWDGRVTLQGPVLADELKALLRTVRRVPGVAEVVNELETHQEPGNVPSLQGGQPHEARGDRSETDAAR